MKKLLILISLFFVCFSLKTYSDPTVTKIDSCGVVVVNGKSIKLTPDQIFSIDSTLAKKIGLNDSIAKAKADSIAKIEKAEIQKIKDDPKSTTKEKTIATIMGAVLTLLGLLSGLLKNKTFDNVFLKRFFGETPNFWKNVSWVSAIVLFISLFLVGVDTLFISFLNHFVESSL